MSELDISVWRHEAFKRQSFYCQYLSNDGQDTLESYTLEKNSLIHLKNKLGFILFGSPNSSDDGKDANDDCRQIENSKKSGITSSNIEPNVTVSEVPVANKSESNHTDDTYNFLVKLLDAPSTDLDDRSTPQIEPDSHYYRQLVNLIFRNDCHQDLIDSLEEDVEQIDMRKKLDSINRERGSIHTSPPNPSSSEDREEYRLYYTDPKQIQQIDRILKQIESCSTTNDHEGIFVSFIFVIAKIENNIGEFPVIRVLKAKNYRNAEISYFIDLTGRCYEGWDNFLKDNIFPSCIYCYPKNGFYSCDWRGNVLVEFGKSPESKLLRKVSQVGDIASNIAGVGCAGVALFSLACPIAAPVLIGTSALGIVSGLWSSGRSISHLVDRKQHKQKLTGREAAGSWLSVATGIVSVASMGALNYTQYLARNGRIIGRAANWVVSGIEATNTGLSGVNIGHQAYNMYKDRDFNAKDMANLAVSLLFFCNSAIKFKTAKQVLIDSQTDIINNIESQLSCRQRKAFKRIVRGTTEKNLMEGNARVIRTVINLEDPRSYFQGISKVVKVANKTKSKVAFSEDASGKLNINGKIEVQPDVMNSMSSKSRQKIFDSSRKWHQSEKYHKLFKKDVKIVSKKENLIFKKNTHELLKKMSMKNKQDIKVNVDKPLCPKVVKNIDGFFKIMKCDNNYDEITAKIKSQVKGSISEFNLYSLIRIIQLVTEGKESYDRAMKYYQDNLKDVFEEFIKDVIEYLNKVFRETNENLRTLKRIFYMKVLNGKEITARNYFETYFEKVWGLVPEADSVVMLAQKAGWLYLLPHDSHVRCIYIAPLRLTAEVEKVWFQAFIKNDSLK